MGKIVKLKIVIITVIALSFFTFLFVIITAVCGYQIGKSYVEEQVKQIKVDGTVINNQLYAERYRALLNKYLLTKGYVSLERIVFYLQRTNNILDTSTLNYRLWEKAYLDNINVEEKQMIPIKTVCKNLKKNPKIPTFTLKNGTNANGVAINVIDLCTVNKKDIIEDNNYNEMYYPLPFTFPLRKTFRITSIVFESRNVNLGLSAEEQAKVDYHSGWDLAVPIGTNFYSICDGTISSVINTQANDLSFNQSRNSTGNYMRVTCNNGLTAVYGHLQYKSQPFNMKKGNIVKKGDLLGRTSTTGMSTGPHLHLGLEDSKGKLLDAMAYIDFTEYEGNE